MTEETPNDPASAEPSLTELARALLTEAAAPARLPGHSWQPPAPEELQAQLPQYEILDRIGRGGMGAVYLATQGALDRLVAIKILSTELDALDPGFSQRFRTEARAMARLSHPGIVAIHEFGETASGLHYIVMEFVEGTNVQQMITASRRLHTEHALAIAAHVCDALHYAHERGIIHRDIKPANIIVGYDGSVKVADFGLAKVGVTGETRQLTQSGTTLGTPHYIAPEALVPGAQADRRADIYAAGVMLYHMLTGKLPQGLFELPSIQVPGLDPRLDAIIARAMREDRDLRYPTAADMRADLDGILTQPIPPTGPGAALPDEARPQRPGAKTQPQILAEKKKPSLWKWAAVPALALATLGGGLHFLGVPSADITPATSSTVPLAPQPLPAEATKDRPFINSLGMKFVPVPGTRVLMCIHETRRHDYAAFAEANPKTDPSWRLVAFRGHHVGETDDHPVVNVNWLEAQTFCKWLGEKEGLTYRLPRDREWSHAVGIADREDPARSLDALKNGVEKVWPWGRDFPPKSPLANLADIDLRAAVKDHSFIHGYRDGHAMTAPVMAYPANALGIHDLGGNVWEWCEDPFGYEQPGRLLRGGSFITISRDWSLSSHRTPRDPLNRSVAHGFRCVLDLGGGAPPPPEEKAAPAAAVQESAVPPPAAPPAQPIPAATKDTPFTNTLGMKFVPVPGIQVLFCIHETRRQDYAAYAETVPGVPTDWRVAAKGGHLVSTQDDHPVVNVNQGDAIAFCAWLGQKENRRYRLPTDREWSCAVGIGHLEPPHATSRSLHQGLRNLRYWGTEWPPNRNNIGNYSDKSYKTLFPQANAIDDGRSYDDGHALIAPVMSYPPNEFGIHDLDGNVWEWCQDFFESPTNSNRGLARGSYWAAYSPGQLLVTHRQTGHGRTRCPDGGFRIVLEAGE